MGAINQMAVAMRKVVEMAQHENKVCYLYKNNLTKEYEASYTYWKDWLFKAWPGGRKQLSVEGTKLFELERK